MAIDKAYTLTLGGKTWAVDCPKVTHVGNATIQPNVYNDFGDVSGTLTISKGDEKPNVANYYIVRFKVNGSVTLVLDKFAIVWANDNPPFLDDGVVYEINILENTAFWAAFE